MTPQEYNRCVELYADRVFRFIMKNIRNQGDAEDVVQNAFEALWKNHSKVEFKKARSYLFTTAYNNMIDNIRKMKRIEYPERIPERIKKDEYANFDLSETLNIAINQLSAIQRSVLLLRDYEGYSYKEIGKITELSESQVKVYIFRARKKLQSILLSLDHTIRSTK